MQSASESCIWFHVDLQAYTCLMHDSVCFHILRWYVECVKVLVCGPSVNSVPRVFSWKSTAAAQRCFHNNQALPCHTGPSSTSRVSSSSSSALFAQRITFPKHTREEEQTPEEHTPPTHTDAQKKRRNRRTPVSCGGLGDTIRCSWGWVVLKHRFMLQDETEN